MANTFYKARTIFNDVAQNYGWSVSLIYNSGDYTTGLTQVMLNHQSTLQALMKIMHKEVSVLGYTLENLTAGTKPAAINYSIAAGSLNIAATPNPAYVSYLWDCFSSSGQRRSVFFPGVPETYVTSNQVSFSGVAQNQANIVSLGLQQTYINSGTNTSNKQQVISIVPGTAPSLIATVTLSAPIIGIAVGETLKLWRCRSNTGFAVGGAYNILSIADGGTVLTIGNYKSGLTVNSGWAYNEVVNYQPITSAVLDAYVTQKKLGGSFPRHKGRKSGGRRLVS